MATPKATEAWSVLLQMLEDMRKVVEDDAQSDLERLEGLRVIGRITTMALELNLDVHTDAPRFYSMDTPVRFVGGPNPDGEYYLAMLDPAHAYRVSGIRGSSTYVGLQILAGTGLNPRRMATNVPDRDLNVGADGRFSIVFSAAEPTTAQLSGDRWVAVPDDASAIVVREYFADRESEIPAELEIERIGERTAPLLPTDEMIAEKYTSAAFTIAKMFTLHRTVKPEMLDRPNEFLTADAEELGSENTTPDNLYMIASWKLAADEALVLDLTPPETRFWNFTLANVWHECIEPRRRPSSLTNAHAKKGPDGNVRLVVSRENPGVPNWIDTGGRERGFMVLRWLDNPSPPPVTTRVVPLAEVGA